LSVPLRIENQNVDIRRLMLYEFWKSNNFSATSVINSVYPNALVIRTCQRWFKKFKNGNFDLSDGPKSERSIEYFTTRLHFTRRELKACRKNGRRLSIMMRIIVD